MPTFKEQLKSLTTCKHKLAVWETLMSYLNAQFISKDGRPADKGILSEECIEERVPEEAIDDVIQEILEGPVQKIKLEIISIETSEVKSAKAKKSS